MSCEFDKNQMISKNIKILHLHNFLLHFFSRGEIQHQIDQMFLTHQQADLA
jgi:hypothetical protein